MKISNEKLKNKKVITTMIAGKEVWAVLDDQGRLINCVGYIRPQGANRLPEMPVENKIKESVDLDVPDFIKMKERRAKKQALLKQQQEEIRKEVRKQKILKKAKEKGVGYVAIAKALLWLEDKLED